MSLPILSRTYKPYVVERASYDGTGALINFTDPVTSQHYLVVGVSILVYSGTALLNLEGISSGKFIEIASGQSFDFPIGTDGIWIKGKGGSCETGVVASLYNKE